MTKKMIMFDIDGTFLDHDKTCLSLQKKPLGH